MTDRAPEVMTCAESLTNPGTCCKEGCTATATWATLDETLTEHTRCGDHLWDGGPRLAAKRLNWDPLWGPATGDDHG